MTINPDHTYASKDKLATFIWARGLTASHRGKRIEVWVDDLKTYLGIKIASIKYVPGHVEVRDEDGKLSVLPNSYPITVLV